MDAQTNSPRFYIWGLDQAAYGPVELPALVSWIKDERVFADTWIFLEQEAAWRRASEVPELRMFFRPKPDTTKNAGPDAAPAIKPGLLRRVKILGNLDDAQLARFAQFMEMQRVSQWAAIVKQGDHGDAMYLILEGELRVRLVAGGRETILATLGPGDFFGDLSLFDQGPRSADVVANVDSTVVKMSAAGFEKLAKEAPDVATPFLLSTIRTLAARIRADNKRVGAAVSFSSAAAGAPPTAGDD